MLLENTTNYLRVGNKSINKRSIKVVWNDLNRVFISVHDRTPGVERRGNLVWVAYADAEVSGHAAFASAEELKNWVLDASQVDVNVIYIDPTNVASGRNGSYANPFNSFAEVTITDGYTYKIKSGTEITTSAIISLSNRTGVTIMPYSSGAMPRIKVTGSIFCAIRMGNSTDCTIDGLDIYTDLSPSVTTLIALSTASAYDGGTGNTIKYCKLHDVKQGTADGGMAIRGGGTNITIQGNEMYNCASDGGYLNGCPGVTFTFNIVHHINQNYAGGSVGFNNLGNGASGDALQLNGDYSGFIVSHNIFDRGDAYTGNKYCVIITQLESQGLYGAGGVFEHNAVITRASVGGGLLIGMTTNTTVRYNVFTSADGTVGSDRLLKLSGYRCVNVTIHHNEFYACDKAIGLGYIYLSNPEYTDQGGSVNTRIYNNVFHAMTSSCIYNDGCLLVEVKNNAFNFAGAAGVALTTSGSPTWVIANNFYDDVAKAGTPGVGTNSVTGSPLFVDATARNFRLQSGSPLRNAGVSVGIAVDKLGTAIPQGAAPDIGCYEMAA